MLLALPVGFALAFTLAWVTTAKYSGPWTRIATASAAIALLACLPLAALVAVDAHVEIEDWELARGSNRTHPRRKP